jgi:processive 1,2-diacylglycerol beta-glucosyltransferase
MKGSSIPKPNSVMVLSAAAATGHLRAAEALARGLVLVIVNPIPGQEERNSDHFLEEGVALRCNNLPALSYKIDHLLSDKERFSKMQQSVERLARPHAASEIVSTILRSKVLNQSSLSTSN